ncbi:cryptochrome/photolyase family protein [Legionella jordanis]|uniref:Deoxyribodipyrimidine photolyase phrB n=1 Tax=Legionella jordanis TaxID=456 RepID=A0A0W0VAJ7_9GAMM|nr:deoxyribodipyrimidine photo-lyase [Legionella jordanis]KTD17120.1 deoxyribodipyrimidine photolyase phrB [Legionella jordanis]RMX03250.1 deoxyribodipyrimidine photo-lyase [Legionella jordanis]VEH12683.1 deoxyribodipyrimidine photolyase phrB [Legionella jordanis]HAT8713168.1 deoxyribodipyrimidine photo-lyase [Legionella jordanis]
MQVAVMWFQQDLRLADNPALAAACERYDLIIPLYIADHSLEQIKGTAQAWWLHESLRQLHIQLRKQGLELFYKQGDALSVLSNLVNNHSVKAIFWNRRYDPAHAGRDKLIEEKLKSRGTQILISNGSLLHEPNLILNQNHKPFRVFSAFWKQLLSQLDLTTRNKIARWPENYPIEALTLEDLGLLRSTLPWSNKFANYWQPGETGAGERLTAFLDNNIKDYAIWRDYPEKDMGSKLSPHVHFGEISPQQIWKSIEQVKPYNAEQRTSITKFLQELAWREFSYYLLHHFPFLAKKSFKGSFDHLQWEESPILFEKWRKGLTGFPMVDAGMRQLWEVGYMPNRVRMVAASFLVKDLLIDWRKGADWFMQTLVDADVACNAVNWQWVAGCGVDAAPYFRILNPSVQIEKFDKDGGYLCQWLPELRRDSKGNIVRNYPEPIINHHWARQRALDFFKSTRMKD